MKTAALPPLLPFLVLMLGAGLASAQTELISLGSVWRYLDDGSDQGNAWRASAFDDSGWASGGAQLGYGDGDEATVVSFGPDSANKFTTTYFRHSFSVADPSAFSDLILEVQRDDGVAVYLNGSEIFRDNLAAGAGSGTFANTAIGGAGETTLLSTSVSPSLVVAGTNVIAVEIHQANPTSSDISFDLRLGAPPPPSIVRGPYLQRASASQVTLRWRTSVITDTVLNYGTDPASLNLSATSPAQTTEHEISIAGLQPDTRYYYSAGDSNTTFASGTDHYVDTHPVSGSASATRIWVLGDSGTANADAAAVRDAYVTFNGNDPHADVLMMLGDNAYNDGTDAEYQAAVFDMYPATLRNSVLWSTLGNHDGHSADSATQSGPYYDIHTFPTAAESGGLASGTEAYYSFDYANIHFVCLDSYETDRSPTGAMATWLANDLAATTQEWIIAFWHHPPYTKGSHDSDTEAALVEMRTNFLPILDLYGVDLVLGGHSHSYERSMLISGHYGTSSTFNSSHIIDGGDGSPAGDGAYTRTPGAADSGTVYAVAGSSGKISSAPVNHPVMISSLIELGSMVLDVDAGKLEAIFLNNNGTVRDSFTIVHDSGTQIPAAPTNLSATAVSDTQIDLGWLDNASDEDGFTVERSIDGTNWSTVAILPADTTSFSDSGLAGSTTYSYRVYASNTAGDSPTSNIAAATTADPPSFIDTLAGAESPNRGFIVGDYTATHADDASEQSLTEVESGGKPSRRHSELNHTWQFELPAGSQSTLYANAYSGGSTEGDDFLFDYSTDGGNSWQVAFTVTTDETDPEHAETALLSGAGAGALLLRVTDTDQTAGNRHLDTLFVDELVVRTLTVAGDPPAAPSGLAANAIAPGQIDLTWIDNASDELGFTLERLDPGAADWSFLANLAADSVSYSDASVLPVSAYSYRLQAFNGSGGSAFSNTAGATTPAGLALQASGYKIKGVIYADLTWSGSSATNVDIYRNGAFLATVTNNGAYTDNTGAKGGATFVYQVCDEGDPLRCSNTATVGF